MDANRRKMLVVGGLGLIAAGGYMLLNQQKASGTPLPGPGPGPGPGVCNYVQVGGAGDQCRILGNSQWYNWSDLRALPLNPNDIPGPSTGGTTDQTGTPTGAGVGYNEAKKSNGIWYCRINGPGGPGDWALRAVDIGANPQRFCPAGSI